MQMLQIRNLCKSFNETRAVDHVSLDVEDGEMLCLLGPSGCGKTTLLMSMSGFLTPDEGSILMDGVDVTDLPPERRPTALVFQNYALFPHLTVFENVAFGLRAKKTPLREIRVRVEEMLEIVGLTGKDGRGIHQLSGGQQQRVALARSLVMKPKVLLLDEPLSNLDAKLRVETRQQIRSIQKSVGITSIFVTHDQEEALTMADRIAVMRDGKIEQHGTPQEIYHNPGNRFVVDFIGKSNFIKGVYDSGKKVYILPSGKELSVDRLCENAREGKGQDALVVRPEYLHIAPLGEAPSDADNRIAGSVRDVTFLGELTVYTVDLGIDGLIRLSIYGCLRQYRVDEKIDVYWDRSAGQLLGL